MFEPGLLDYLNYVERDEALVRAGDPGDHGDHSDHGSEAGVDCGGQDCGAGGGRHPYQIQGNQQ